MKIYKVGFAKGYNVLTEVSDTIQPQMFDGRSLRSSWHNPEVRVEQLHRNDEDSHFPFLSYGALVVSDDAFVRLRECLSQEEFEVLPLRCHQNEFGYQYNYRLINIINMVDCLDLGRSTITSVAGKIMRIDKYVFNSSVLREVKLFKIPQTPYVSVFATDLGRNCFKRAGSDGLEFREVYSDGVLS